MCNVNRIHLEQQHIIYQYSIQSDAVAVIEPETPLHPNSDKTEVLIFSL